MKSMGFVLSGPRLGRGHFFGLFYLIRFFFLFGS